MMISSSHLDAERDEVLVALAGTGSGAAFAVLVTRHRGAVCVIARNLCATNRDSEQVLQETFLSAWRSLRTLCEGETFGAVLYRIAVRTALAHRQRERRGNACSLEGCLPAFESAGRQAGTDGRWWRHIDESTGDGLELTGVLREALECIDDRTRAAFVLRDLLELSPEEAAAVLETSPDVIRQEAHRARLMLRGFIDQL